jgi:hypothetical protein
VSVHRLEIEDEYFNTASAVLLPDVPAKKSTGDAQEVNFSDEQLWKELTASHETFAETVRDRSFDPEADGAAIDRYAGLGVLLTALRFLEANQSCRLLITGHTDRSGGDDYNLRLSAARARGVLAVLEGDREAFVCACHEFHADEDDVFVLRYMVTEHGWDCEPGGDTKSDPHAVEAFQRTYNDRFSKSITVDGVVGDQTWGAYFDVYQNDLAAMARSQADLDILRGKLRFVSSQKKFLPCGEHYPIENPAKDGYRSQLNRRVELLFFEPRDIPDPADERTPDLIYKHNLFRFDVLGPGDLTEMASLGETDAADLWAFLEPFDSSQPAAGRQSIGASLVPAGGVLV